MTHLDQEASAVLGAARLATVNAKWRLCEEQALQRLYEVRGLACTPLFPGHPVIQVVACDGRLLGRVRRHHDGHRTRWIAVPARTAREIGAYRTLHHAARVLARRTGRGRLRVADCPAGAQEPPPPENPR
ncbi:hypothetical protein NX794_21130 [Streptomyces sp. LP11]|uniref:Uncharacterized protein n=1 Tax=Streptomyces pyxinicus TaxID=2970331 RepID=A0ABT2B598_9ACTN|nr:hypothetical protein [Streptomyces sp. LP11]MCS0603699.1 hypothetical protein [Streptomyces sp. LP11]